MVEKVWPMDPTGEQLPRGLAEVNTGHVESLSGYDWDDEDDEDDYLYSLEDDIYDD